MIKQVFHFFLFTSIFFVGYTSIKAQGNRPKIGLVLSGGGAKGIAHIGVLKVLEEAGIRPDYITGTSIGSIVGGLYAIGYSVEQLERLAIELDWKYYFNDELKRKDLPFEERNFSERYQLKLAIENGSIQLPKGFVQGKKIALLLSQLTLPAHGITDFNQFKIPFKCVATDAATGKPVVLSNGSLAKAMRASMSIPSIFEPIELQGKLLIDGGVARNLPVEEVIAMGADIVIAVDITSDLYNKDSFNSLIDVLEQTSSFGLVEDVKEQLALADVVIRPAINDIGTLDFDKGSTLLSLGQEAAHQMLPKLKELIGNTILPDCCNPNDSIHLLTAYEIQEANLTGIQNINSKKKTAVSNILSLNILKEYPVQHIEDRIKQLLGGQYFKDVFYEIKPLSNTSERYELSIDATTQSGDFFQLGINYDSDLKAALLLNTSFRDKGLRGSKFSTDLKVSENPYLLATYQVYTTTQPSFGIQINGFLNHYPVNFYNNNGLIDEVSRMQHYLLRLDLFSNFKNNFNISWGIGAEYNSLRNNYFDSDTETMRLSQVATYIDFIRDSYDRQNYPKTGSYFALKGRLSFFGKLHIMGEEIDKGLTNINELLHLQFSKVFPLGDYLAFRWYNDAGYIGFEADNFLNLFYLGRRLVHENEHIPFIGLDYMELPVTSYWLSGLKLRAELKPNFFGSLLFNYTTFKSNSYQVALEEMIETTAAQKGSVLGIGMELGIITPLGPCNLSAEYNLETDRANFALHLGYWF